MGVTYGFNDGHFSCDDDSHDDCRDDSGQIALADVAGTFPSDALASLIEFFTVTMAVNTKENSMDIKTILKTLEDAGLKITTQNVAPLVGDLVQLGVAAAEKGISDLSHKAGVADPTKD